MRDESWRETTLNELSSYIKQLLKEDPLFQNPAELDSIEKRVAFHVKRFRKANQYTQFDLAEAMGVKQPFIARIESGKNNISIKKLAKLAEVLHIDPVHILRPIYEEGKPEKIARIILNRQYLIMAINQGGEVLLKDRRENLIGKPIGEETPLRTWIEKMFTELREQEEHHLTEQEYAKYGFYKASIRLLKGKMEKILGAEVTGYL